MSDFDPRAFQTQLRSLHRRQRREWAPAHGMSRTSMRVLGAVARGEGVVSPGEIADELVMTSSNVAAALRELVIHGLVVKERDADDSRRLRLRLTDAGAALVAQRREAHDSWLADAVSAVLSESEQLTLAEAGELMARLARYEMPQPEAAQHGTALGARIAR